MQHLEQAHKAGLSDNDIAAIENDPSAVQDASLALLLRFVDACVESPSVPEEVFALVREMLSPGHIAAVIVLVGHYMMVARLIGILQIPVHAKPDAWQQEH